MRYEWRKLWQNSMFLKITGFLLLLNIAVLMYNIMQKDINQSYLGLEPVIQEMDAEYHTLDPDKAREIWMKSLFEETDMKKTTARSLLLQQYDYIEQYPAYLETVQEQASKMRKFSIFSDKDSFSYRNIMKTGEDFKRCEGITVEIGTEWGIHVMNSYFVGDLTVLIAVFLVINILFWQEKEKGLYPMIRCTRNGRGKLMTRKVIVLGVITVVLCLLFYIPIVAICWKMFGFGDVNRSIQSISSFRECILPLTIKDYILLFVGMKTLAIVGFAFCIACACIWFAGMGQVFALIGVIGGVGYVCFHSIPALSVWNFFKYINPSAFLDAEGMIGVYQNISIFGYPVNRIVLSVSILGGMSFVGCVGVIVGFVRRNAVLHAASSSKIMEWIRKRMHYYRTIYLTKQEWIRFLIQRKGILLLACVVWIAMTSIQQKESFYESKVMNYRTLVKEHQGPLTEDLQEKIEQKKKAIENGEDSLLAEGLFLFDQQYQTVLELQKDSDLLGQMIDQTSWEYVFFSPNRDYQQTAIWVAVVLFIVMNVFGSDYRKNEICLLQTTKKGRSHLSRTRMGICIFLAFAIGILMRGVIAWNATNYHPIGDCMAPIWSIPRFDLLGDLPIWSILVLGGALKLLGITVIVLLMAWITMKIQKQTTAMIVGLLLFEMPVFIEIGGISVLRFFTVANAFYPYELLEESPVRFAAYFAVLFMIAIVFFIKIWRRERVYSKR